VSTRLDGPVHGLQIGFLAIRTKYVCARVDNEYHHGIGLTVREGRSQSFYCSVSGETLRGRANRPVLVVPRGPVTRLGTVSAARLCRNARHVVRQSSVPERSTSVTARLPSADVTAWQIDRLG